MSSLALCSGRTVGTPSTDEYFRAQRTNLLSELLQAIYRFNISLKRTHHMRTEHEFPVHDRFLQEIGHIQYRSALELQKLSKLSESYIKLYKVFSTRHLSQRL